MRGRKGWEYTLPMVTFISGHLCLTRVDWNWGVGWKPGGEDGQAGGLAAEEDADVLALVEEGAVGLAGVILLGVDGGEAEGEEEMEHPGEKVRFVSLSSSDSAEVSCLQSTFWVGLSNIDIWAPAMQCESKWSFRSSMTFALKLKFPRKLPLTTHWTVQLTLPNNLSFFPQKLIFLHWTSFNFNPNSRMRRWSTYEEDGVGKLLETRTAKGLPR